MLAPQTEPNDKLWLSCGLTRHEAEALEEAARRVAQQTGIGFFDGTSHDGGARTRASALPRQNESSRQLIKLIECLDTSPLEAAFIVQSFVALARPSRRQAIRIEDTAAAQLQALIKEHCKGLRLEVHDAGQIIRRCSVRDESDKNYNHVLAWVLAAMAIIHYAACANH